MDARLYRFSMLLLSGLIGFISVASESASHDYIHLRALLQAGFRAVTFHQFIFPHGFDGTGARGQLFAPFRGNGRT